MLGEEAAVGVGEGGMGEEIGAAGAGAEQGLLAPPAGDAGVIAARQRLRDGEATKLRRAGVVRLFEQAVRERLFGE